MTDAMLTMIVPDAQVALARTIAATLSEGGKGIWTTPLSSDGTAPATHWISSGFVPAAWLYMVPVRTYEQTDGAWGLVNQTAGDPAAVIAGCAEQGVTIDAKQVAKLFAAADVTEQEPQTALGRLGLRLVQSEA